ncbi:CHAD domain-containing protein [Streptomyces aidingensis]|uniref:CHAD domain-containing protein n=1 Tax=Streptomyces aidingensis TaxID=910347 RepID=A0A1I1FIS1_9ACTN|nr:CHAD domain-containing protein [Streptomyces aidingensis]SFB99171.1 CHAD domain-containing protein [Streptomyces aidingensis]
MTTATTTSVRPAAGTAGATVVDYAGRQARELRELEPEVRRDAPDSVHRMRVACRRLRSCFRSYRRVLDRTVTAALEGELIWLAGELSGDRDREVLAERFRERLAELPPELIRGPARDRLRDYGSPHEEPPGPGTPAGRSATRARVLAALDSDRFRDLLSGLDALLAVPPLLPAAGRRDRKVCGRVLEADADRFDRRMAAARAAPPGPLRDHALHAARKAAKRARYSAEAARPALGRTAARAEITRWRALQDLLGEHQDSVMARQALVELAVTAEAAGEPSFTYGLLHGRERALAEEYERRLAALHPGHPAADTEETGAGAG